MSHATDSISRTTSSPVNDANYGADADAVSDSPVRDARPSDGNDGDAEEEDATWEWNADAADGSDDGNEDEAPAEAESVDDDDWDVADQMGVKVVTPLALESGKEFPGTAAYAGVDVEDFLTLGGTPWFYVKALEADRFVDRYVSGGWLPCDLPLEWTR